MTVDNQDVWVGDVFKTKDEAVTMYFLVEGFFTLRDQQYCRGYYAEPGNGRHFQLAFWKAPAYFRVTDLATKFPEPVCIEQCLSRTDAEYEPLTDFHSHLLTTRHFMKHPVLNRTGEFYKVKIVPLILFADDTSGNMSKQYNKYDSWLMRCAALPYTERMKRENSLFIATVPGSHGIDSVSLVPKLVEDLKKLEDGVIMYSAEHKEDVLVYAPLLLIEADNPCHSDLCCLKGLKTLYCCRSCYFHNKVTPRNSPNDPPSAEALNAQYRKRTRADYVAASSDPNRRCRIAFGPVNADGLPLYKTASELGFKKTGAEDLLKLEAFDPSQDTPVEVLHTVMLGIVKYMVQDLYRNRLKNNPDKLQQMHNALR
ncbi:hypothetical protein BJV82DRAFT_676256, partial [Fennellomyces sp. T-0311]